MTDRIKEDAERYADQRNTVKDFVYEAFKSGYIEGATIWGNKAIECDQLALNYVRALDLVKKLTEVAESSLVYGMAPKEEIQGIIDEAKYIINP